jgi:hypothetical protein
MLGELVVAHAEEMRDRGLDLPAGGGHIGVFAGVCSNDDGAQCNEVVLDQDADVFMNFVVQVCK